MHWFGVLFLTLMIFGLTLWIFVVFFDGRGGTAKAAATAVEVPRVRSSVEPPQEAEAYTYRNRDLNSNALAVPSMAAVHWEGQELTGPPGFGRAVAIGPKALWVASDVGVYRYTSGADEPEWSDPLRPVDYLAVSPDGSQVAACKTNGEAYLLSGDAFVRYRDIKSDTVLLPTEGRVVWVSKGTLWVGGTDGTFLQKITDEAFTGGADAFGDALVVRTSGHTLVLLRYVPGRHYVQQQVIDKPLDVSVWAHQFMLTKEGVMVTADERVLLVPFPIRYQ